MSEPEEIVRYSNYNYFPIIHNNENEFQPFKAEQMPILTGAQRVPAAPDCYV